MCVGHSGAIAARMGGWLEAAAGDVRRNKPPRPSAAAPYGNLSDFSFARAASRRSGAPHREDFENKTRRQNAQATLFNAPSSRVIYYQ